MAISERRGDQAGFADSYHRLSRIAELRGEYGPAEEHYRRALAIKERLGDQASLATTRGQLGAFYTERGRSDQAVPYTLAALAFSHWPRWRPSLRPAPPVSISACAGSVSNGAPLATTASPRSSSGTSSPGG